MTNEFRDCSAASIIMEGLSPKDHPPGGRKRNATALSDQSISPPPLKKRAVASMAAPANECVRSPFRLTRIDDLPEELNRSTVSLKEILGDPLIKECWLFGFLYDVDWVMTHFDPDVRHLVAVKVVHGSWRQDDFNRVGIDEAVQRYPNVEAITAYMPEAFGTHHTKMIVLFRHDGNAQTIICTANMIHRDWAIVSTDILIFQPKRTDDLVSDDPGHVAVTKAALAYRWLRRWLRRR